MGSLLGIYLIMILVAAIVIFPVYWMFSISLKLPKEIYRMPSLVPDNPTWANYRTLIEKKDYLTNIRNSIIVSSSVTVVSLLISSFAAYSIVRFRYSLDNGACVEHSPPAWSTAPARMPGRFGTPHG